MARRPTLPQAGHGRGRRRAAERLSALKTLSELSAPGLSETDLERIIGEDVGLLYKLLRYVNSGFFNLVRRVESIREPGSSSVSAVCANGRSS